MEVKELVEKKEELEILNTNENPVQPEKVDDKKDKSPENEKITKDDDNLNVKVIKNMNKYYENLYKELSEKNSPEDKEKLEAIKKELELNKEILEKINEPTTEKKEPKEEEKKEEKPKEEKKEVETKKEEKLTIILDCGRGEYLFKKEDTIDLKAQEIRVKLLENKKAGREYIEHLQSKFGDFIKDEIDITLCKALEEHYKEEESDEIIKKYIDAINDKNKAKLPFEMVYNFNGMKDLKREGFLNKTAINKLSRVADTYLEYGLANVQKEETGFKRIISSVKRFFSKREFHGNIPLLTEGEKSRKIKIEFNNGLYTLECGNSKGKKYGDVYIYDAKCKIDEEEEIDKMEELYDLHLSNKEISRLDTNIYKLLKYFENFNIRMEDRDLNNLAESYLQTIISKEVKYDVQNLLEINYDFTYLDDVDEEIISDSDKKQIRKKAKFAEKIGLAYIELDGEEQNIDNKIIEEIKNEQYFCKIADENDLDEENKKALEKVNEQIKEEAEKLGKGQEETALMQIAKSKGISLRAGNNQKKTLEQLKLEIIEQMLK